MLLLWAGGEGMGEKLFCCVLLLPGLLGPELT